VTQRNQRATTRSFHRKHAEWFFADQGVEKRTETQKKKKKKKKKKTVDLRKKCRPDDGKG